MPARYSITHALAPLLLALLPALGGACGEAPAQVEAPHPKPAQKMPAPVSTSAINDGAEPPMPSLRTGALVPIVHETPIDVQPIGSQVAGDHEILRFEVPLDAAGLKDALSYRRNAVVDVERAAGDPVPLAFLEWNGTERPTLWVRRPRAMAGKPIAGTIFTTVENEYGGLDHAPGHRIPFKAARVGPASSGSGLLRAWASSLAEHLRTGRWGSPFHAFAAARATLLGEPKGQASAKAPLGPAGPTPARPSGEALSSLMATTTGMMSIQETLQVRQSLFISTHREKPTLPIDKVEGPRLKAHPFREMLADLKAPVPAEPLAAYAPAAFYYIRFAGIGDLFRVLDGLDTWGTPIGTALDDHATDYGLSARYEAALGLGRGPLSRALGPEVVGSVAVVGSDPYVKEGTDITMLFVVKKSALFEAGMAAALAGHSAAHGGFTTSKASHEGVDIKITTSADNAVRQHRASMGDIEIVSNSIAAISTVIDATKKKAPCLEDEPDFRYMLARDAATRADVLAFLGDRFVGEVVGPRQKILEARRQFALAELSTPGYAALLFGHIWGRSPASAEELIKSGLLGKEELKHGGGEAIAWKPGEAARSSWGSPAALTPLLDLPAPTTVTSAERAGYEQFVRGYQSYWSTYIDPVMIRGAIESAGGAGSADKRGSITMDVRVVPLIDGTDYRQLQRMVGDARVDPPPTMSGARVVLGVGPDADLRRELASFIGPGIVGRSGLKLDWIGEWAMLGVADRTPVAVLAANANDGRVLQRPMTPDEQGSKKGTDSSLIDDIARTPLFAEIGIKSMMGAALAITAVRALSNGVLPGLVEWGEAETYRSTSIVKVTLSGGGGLGLVPMDPPMNLYYAFCESALVLSLRHEVMRDLIDERLDKKTPAPAPAVQAGRRGAPQLVIDIAPSERGPIWTVLGWLLEAEMMSSGRRTRHLAEALLRGAPERSGDAAAMRALGFATFGQAPVAPHGGAYSLGPDGVRDPVRGTRHAPVWPALPVPGSPVEKALTMLTSFRAELAFDEEVRPRGGERTQSLHARVRFGTHE